MNLSKVETLERVLRENGVSAIDTAAILESAEEYNLFTAESCVQCQELSAALIQSRLETEHRKGEIEGLKNEICVISKQRDSVRALWDLAQFGERSIEDIVKLAKSAEKLQADSRDKTELEIAKKEALIALSVCREQKKALEAEVERLRASCDLWTRRVEELKQQLQTEKQVTTTIQKANDEIASSYKALQAECERLRKEALQEEGYRGIRQENETTQEVADLKTTIKVLARLVSQP